MENLTFFDLNQGIPGLVGDKPGLNRYHMPLADKPGLEVDIFSAGKPTLSSMFRGKGMNFMFQAIFLRKAVIDPCLGLVWEATCSYIIVLKQVCSVSCEYRLKARGTQQEKAVGIAVNSNSKQGRNHP